VGVSQGPLIKFWRRCRWQIALSQFYSPGCSTSFSRGLYCESTSSCVMWCGKHLLITLLTCCYSVSWVLIKVSVSLSKVHSFLSMHPQLFACGSNTVDLYHLSSSWYNLLTDLRGDRRQSWLWWCGVSAGEENSVYWMNVLSDSAWKWVPGIHCVKKEHLLLPSNFGNSKDIFEQTIQLYNRHL